MAIYAYILRFLIVCLSLLCLPAKLFSKLQRPKRCPPIENDVLKIPALHLAEKIRKKELTSEYLVQTYISRIKEVNVILNAVVQERFDDAVLEAKNVDKLISNDSYSHDYLLSNKPFFGIPFTVKESIPLEGLSNRAGSLVYERTKAESDAKIVSLLREAGGIPLLVSNVPELCMNWETNNKITGKTCNPYDTRRTCGGSSGGEAALLSSGASVIGLGSDVGGSLRIPPHFCGIWGHKPTPGALYCEDHFPNCTDKELWPIVFTVGPMSRYAVDLPMLLHTIANQTAKDAMKLKETVDLKNIKVFYMEHDGGSVLTNKVDHEIIEGMRRFVNYLQNTHGISAQKVKIKGMKSSPLALLSLLQIEGVTSVVKEGKSGMAEMMRYLFGFSKATFVPLLHASWQPIVKCITSKSRLESVKSELDLTKNEILNILGQDGVLLYPSFPTTAHFHNEIFYKVFDTSYLAIFNELGLPSTSCTLGLHKNGLPMGIQAITSPYNDRLALRIAEEIEIAFGGWKPPPFSKRAKKISDL